MTECKKILYAEDEEDIQLIAKLALEDIAGFTLKICSNGKEVLDVIESFKPDLLLLDVMMPKMDGVTVIAEIRKMSTFKDIPVIVMTARTLSNEIEEYLKLGAIGIIVKPFDVMKLGDEIKKIWKESYG